MPSGDLDVGVGSASGIGHVRPRRPPFFLGVALSGRLPFVSLVAMTSTITLLVFAIVNLALWQLQRRRPRAAGFRVPRFIPPLAAVANVVLALAQFLA